MEQTPSRCVVTDKDMLHALFQLRLHAINSPETPPSPSKPWKNACMARFKKSATFAIDTKRRYGV
jgi:hypothetical protein